MLDFSAMTWTCMVCGEERPDEKISVFPRPIKGMEQSFPDSRTNVRFCNDRLECLEWAAAPGPWRGGLSTPSRKP